MEPQLVSIVYGLSSVLHVILFLAAIVLAIVNMKRCRGASIMLIIGAALGMMIVGVTIIGPVIRARMGPGGDIMTVMAIQGAVIGLLSLVSHGLFIAAVLVGRRAPSMP